MQRVSSVLGTALRGQSIAVSPSGLLAVITEEELFILESSDDLNLLISSSVNPSTTFRAQAVYALPDLTQNTDKHGCTRLDSVAWITDDSLIISGFRNGDPVIDIFHRSSRTVQSLLASLPEVWASALILAINNTIGNLADEYPNWLNLLSGSRLLVTSVGIAIGNIFLANIFHPGHRVYGVEVDSEISALKLFEDQIYIGTVDGSLYMIDIAKNSRHVIFDKHTFPVYKIACMRMHADSDSAGGIAVACLTGNRLIGRMVKEGTDTMQLGTVAEIANVDDLKVNEPLGVFMAIKESGKLSMLRLTADGITVAREISMSVSGKICSSVVSASGIFLFFSVSSKRLEIYRKLLVADGAEISDLFLRGASPKSLEEVYSSIARLGKISERPEICDLTLIGLMKRLGISWTAGEAVGDRIPLMLGLHCLYWKLYRMKSSIKASQMLATETEERIKIFADEFLPVPSFVDGCPLCGSAMSFDAFSRRFVCENSHWLAVSAISSQVMAWDTETLTCRHCGSCAEHEVVCPVCKGSILSRQ